MSLYLGTNLLAGIATNTISNAHDLFDFKWTDHELTDQSWLRADTFSWQDGTVYSDAYNHLVEDYNNAGVEASASDTIGGITVWYRLCADGHKICPPDQESNVLAIYNATGVAWYYILDITNQRFKLPRENPAQKELKISAPVMADHTKITSLMATKYGNVLFKTSLYEHTTGSVGDDKALYTISTVESPTSDFDTHLYSNLNGGQGLYQGKKYLYFYVGQFSQSATEQTAGLNSELFNGKLDLDGNNANANTVNNLIGKADSTAKQMIVGWGIPDYSRTTSASKTVGQVQSVLVDSEIRVIQTGTSNNYYMYYNIVPCDSNGTEITGYCLTSSGGYTGATSGNSMLLKAGSYFKVKSWSAMTNDNSILITPLFGG